MYATNHSSINVLVTLSQIKNHRYFRIILYFYPALESGDSLEIISYGPFAIFCLVLFMDFTIEAITSTLISHMEKARLSELNQGLRTGNMQNTF